MCVSTYAHEHSRIIQRAWFDLRFDLLWDYVYELLGEKPPRYMKYVALIEGEVVEVDDPSVKM